MPSGRAPRCGPRFLRSLRFLLRRASRRLASRRFARFAVTFAPLTGTPRPLSYPPASWPDCLFAPAGRACRFILAGRYADPTRERSATRVLCRSCFSSLASLAPSMIVHRQTVLFVACAPGLWPVLMGSAARAISDPSVARSSVVSFVPHWALACLRFATTCGSSLRSGRAGDPRPSARHGGWCGRH